MVKQNHNMGLSTAKRIFLEFNVFEERVRDMRNEYKTLVL